MIRKALLKIVEDEKTTPCSPKSACSNAAFKVNVELVRAKPDASVVPQTVVNGELKCCRQLEPVPAHPEAPAGHQVPNTKAINVLAGACVSCNSSDAPTQGSPQAVIFGWRLGNGDGGAAIKPMIGQIPTW